MNMQLIHKIGKKFMKKVPVIKAGNTVRVHQRIKEGGKERIQIFEGLVIAVNSGNGPDKTFTVRKMVGSIGVEKIFPLYSKNITKIQVTKSGDVRRSKLYYMRKRSGKSARLREKHLTEKDVAMEDFEEQTEAPEAELKAEEKAEEAVAETAPEAPTEEAPVEEEKPVEEAPAAEEAPKEEVIPPAEEEATETPGEKAEEDPTPTASDPEEEPKE
jgi:large subunit ribosomal protein L19